MAYKAKSPRVYISQRGGRKKIYKNQYVYLKNGDSFDIEIENPTKKTVLAKIELDGKSISNSGLVVRPGERFLLERFIDEDRKFKFNTYEIDGSDSDMVDAVSENGKLKVTFYKEQEVKQYCNPCIWRYYPYQPYPYDQYPYSSPTIYTGGTNGHDNITLDSLSGQINLDGSTSNFYCSTNINETTNFTSNTGMSFEDLGLDGVLEDKVKDSDNNFMETGRTEKGEKSDQEFDYVDMDFQTYISYTTELQILPESRKPISKKTQSKTYCHNCGFKAKKGDSFCSKCGTELYK